MNHLSTGAGFLPSTLSLFFRHNIISVPTLLYTEDLSVPKKRERDQSTVGGPWRAERGTVFGKSWNTRCGIHPFLLLCTECRTCFFPPGLARIHIATSERYFHQFDHFSSPYIWMIFIMTSL